MPGPIRRRDVLIAVARMADRLGYDAFFIPETWAHDITVLLAEVKRDKSVRRWAGKQITIPIILAPQRERVRLVGQP